MSLKLARCLHRYFYSSRSMLPQIQLAPHEDEIVTALDNFARILREQEPHLPAVELRIAGGWVRDKARCDCRLWKRLFLRSGA